ncbi:hypothetical protein Hanom_Chr00s000002g01601051 [Helianthus anomalus]
MSRDTTPRLSSLVCFCLSFSLRNLELARPHACLLICCSWSWSWGEAWRDGMMYQLLFFCIYVGFCR